MMRGLGLAALLLAAMGTAPNAWAAPATETVRPLPTIPLTIRSHGRTLLFRVELARSDAEQARGLMFRKSIAPYGGMLFPFDPPRPASFWMKNTLVPLDMVFVRADGTIARIAAMTTPLSLDPVEVGEPVAAVLELRGGRASQLHIDEHSHVGWRGGPDG